MALLSSAFVLAAAVLTYPHHRVDAAGDNRELNDAAPQSGMTKLQSGLDDVEWTKHLTLANEPGCRNEDCCNQCKGWCGSDDDCYGILKCLKREGETTPVPGCILPETGYGGNVCYLDGADYYAPSPPLPNPLITKWWPLCTNDQPCDKCEGLCDVGEDGQCKGDLRCSSFYQNKWPNGDKNCNENGRKIEKQGYCMPAEDFVGPITDKPSADWDPTVPDRGELIIVPECPPDGCPACTAPMDEWWGCGTTSNHCAAGLECYDYHVKEVDKGQEQVSGCSGNKIGSFGYCYTKDTSYKPPAITHLTEAPSNEDFVLTNAVGAPEECAIYAVDQGNTIDVPFSGSSQVTTNNAFFQKVTYIYVIDTSKSTKENMSSAECGDGNSDLEIKTPLDCEILAIQKVNEAANAGGNVDLVGLISFNNTAKVLQSLIEPWTRLNDDRRDPAVIDLSRTLVPEESTNYEAGVELACEMARGPSNDNLLTVVIFLSDGAPNLGNSAENTIKNNCTNAIFQTFAVTEAADCDKVDSINLRPGIDAPDTLREIASFSGGVCAQVADVSILPELLVNLEETTWDGVTVKVNGQFVDSPTINYSINGPLPFAAPGSYTYAGSVPLGPGQHEVCLVTSSSTSGIKETTETCKTVVVNALETSPVLQQVVAGTNAAFDVTFIGEKPGCDAFVNKTLTVDSCDGSTSVTSVKTGDVGSASVTVSAIDGADESCYKVCYEAPNGEKSCTETVVKFTTAAPITPIPATSIPSGSPSSAPATPGPTTSVPSTFPSSGPSGAPNTPNPTTAVPSMSPSQPPSGAPITPVPTTAVPSSPPSGAPSTALSSAPSNSPGMCDVKANIECTIKNDVADGQIPCAELTCSPDNCKIPVTYTYTVSAASDDALVIESVNSSVDGLLTMPDLQLTVGESTFTTKDGVIDCCVDSVYDYNVTVKAKTNDDGAKPCGASFMWSMATGVLSDVPSGSPSKLPSGSPITPAPTTLVPSGSQSSAPVTPEPTTSWPSTSSYPSSSPSKESVNPSDAPITPGPITDAPPTTPAPTALVPSGSPSSAPVTPEPTTPWPSTSSYPSSSPSKESIKESVSPSDAPITQGSTTDAPIASKSATASPVTNAPSPISLSLSPPASPYCNVLDENNASCKLCEPFRSPDYCDPSESFPSLVQARTSKVRNDPSLVSADGYWFHALEDKIAGYLLTVDQALPAPEVYCCVTKVEELAECLEAKGFKEVGGGFTINESAGKGIVVKATTFHSNQGVFILVNETSYGSGEAYDLIQKSSFTFSDVSTALGQMQASKVIVEEFVGTSLPVEYKLHVINGTVQAIDVIHNRGEDCACFAVVDTEFNRLDYHGCFEPGGTDYKDPTNPECTSIDFDTGALKAGPVKKDMYLCGKVVKPSPCVIEDMISMAEKLGKRIGVAMRVDMFVVDKQVYVQEYSPNPMNGLRHCAAKVDENSCVDSCFLGREWKASGGGTEYGGPTTAVPDKLKDYFKISDEARCGLIGGVAPSGSFTSACIPPVPP